MVQGPEPRARDDDRRGLEVGDQIDHVPITGQRNQQAADSFDDRNRRFLDLALARRPDRLVLEALVGDVGGDSGCQRRFEIARADRGFGVPTGRGDESRIVVRRVTGLGGFDGPRIVSRLTEQACESGRNNRLPDPVPVPTTAIGFVAVTAAPPPRPPRGTPRGSR